MSKSEAKHLLAVAKGQKPGRRPIWFMRQAGRYLPEYMAVREKVSFLELCQTPELAAEVTLQPLRRYDLDASIIFSDILIPPTAMGQKLTFDKGHGPVLTPEVRSAADLKRLIRPDVSKELGFVGDAIVAVKNKLQPHQTMIGFAGAPFTVASYMVEGRGSKTFTEIKRLAFTDTSTFVALLDLIAEVTIEYLRMQVEAGADVVMLFDTWAAQLTGHDYRQLVYPATVKVMQAMHKDQTPIIYFPGQGSEIMSELNGMPVDVIAVDWRVKLTRAINTLKLAGLNVPIQGNLDPQLLIAPEGIVRDRTREILQMADQHEAGHIFNLGHGLQPHTPPESLNWVIDEVRSHDSKR